MQVINGPAFVHTNYMNNPIGTGDRLYPVSSSLEQWIPHFILWGVGCTPVSSNWGGGVWLGYTPVLSSSGDRGTAASFNEEFSEGLFLFCPIGGGGGGGGREYPVSFNKGYRKCPSLRPSMCGNLLFRDV